VTTGEGVLVASTTSPVVAVPAPTTRFRGWRVVTAAFSVLAVAYGTQFSYGVFVKSIGAETGWSRTALSTPYAIYVGLYSLLSSVSGWSTDRWGPRRAIATGALFLAAGWALLGRVSQLWQVYVLLGVVAAIGMSVSWVPCNATVVRWFVRRRGLAVGITSSGGSVGNLLVPPVAILLIRHFGWRTTLTSMGVFAGLVLLVASRFMIRSPEEVGQFPDGDDAPPVLESGGLGPALSLGEARRTRTYWVMTAIFAMTWLVVFVPFVHVAAYTEDLGATPFQSSLVISSIGVGGVLGRLGAGPASDRLGRRAILATTLAIQVACFAAFSLSQGLAAMLVAAFFFGFSYGGSVTCFPALVGDKFGRRHAGTIVGAIFATSGTVAAVGPFAAGYLYDQLGSYRLAFALGGAANAVALLLVPLLGSTRPGAGGADPPLAPIVGPSKGSETARCCADLSPFASPFVGPVYWTGGRSDRVSVIR
jgi:MFS transporter, OFA family, oxalate/formate antiporter